MSKKIYASPLLYTGGKKHLAQELISYIPDTSPYVMTPFMGGGAFELNAAIQGHLVRGCDIDPNCINFWEHWLDYAELIDEAAKVFIKRRSRDELQAILRGAKLSTTDLAFPEVDAFGNAVRYYAFSRLGHSGQGIRGGYVKKFFIKDGIIQEGARGKNARSKIGYVFPSDNGGTGGDVHHRLPFDEYRNLGVLVEHLPFEESIELNPDVFLYCDPPFFGSESFYNGKMNHHLLAEILHGRGNWVLSYNDHPDVKWLFRDYRWKEVKRRYAVHGSDNRELLIFSNDIEGVEA